MPLFPLFEKYKKAIFADITFNEGTLMNKAREIYQEPTLTKVKFEDQNLVMFLSCSKQMKVEGSVTNGCCELMPEQIHAATFDPS